MNNINDFIVYKHTCPNGKVYIGLTCQKAQYRWGKDGNGYKEQLFYRAIQKYGWNNIKHEIVYNNLTQQEAEEREAFLIEMYESYNKAYGYNIDLGGGGAKRLSKNTKEKLRQANLGKKYSKETRAKVSKALTGRPVSEETRKKISKSNKGNHNFFGKHHTEDTKQKLSKERIGKGNPMYGKHHTEKARQKISLSNIGNKKRLGQKHSEETKQKMKNSARRGSDNHASKKVICLNNNMIFDCMRKAADWAGIKNSSDIGSVCMGKRKSAGKHPDNKEPLRWSYYEEVINE